MYTVYRYIKYLFFIHIIKKITKFNEIKININMEKKKQKKT